MSRSTAPTRLLIADTGNAVIRRVSPTGTITTVAGHPGGSTGQPPSATPTAATSVDLDAPTGVAAIQSGGFLIADTAREPRAACLRRREVDDHCGHRHCLLQR
jgi:hypothetical protein